MKKTYHPKGYRIIKLITGAIYLVKDNTYLNNTSDEYYAMCTDSKCIFAYWRRERGKIIINHRHVVCQHIK